MRELDGMNGDQAAVVTWVKRCFFGVATFVSMLAMLLLFQHRVYPHTRHTPKILSSFDIPCCVGKW